MCELQIDKEVCDHTCTICEDILTGFKTKHKGKLRVSRERYTNDPEVKLACNAVMSACPKNAIYLD